MRRTLAGLIGIVTIVAVAVAAQSAVGGPPKKAKPNRWLVTASVANGSQILTRIDEGGTYRGHHGSGNIDSHWRAQWRIHVRVINRQMLIPGATAFSVTGGASGEYRGYYPKPGGVTATYTCPFGTITAKQVLSRLHFQGPTDRQGNVGLTFGVDGEPGTLPPLGCSGDAVEPEVTKTISAGVLTGIESACYPSSSIKRAQLNARKPFTVFKKFGWDPPSPSGNSRSCSGFGAPIRSAGSGTLRLRFVPIA